MSKMKIVKIAVVITLSLCANSFANFPFAKGLVDDLNNGVVWEKKEVAKYVEKTIVPGGGTVKEKDIRSNSKWLGYSSLAVEGKSFNGVLDLSNVKGFVDLHILVDDKAKLYISGDGGYSKTLEVDGSALWRSQSYREFGLSLPAGQIYKLLLTYKNTANLTPRYDGQIDVDGVVVLVSVGKNQSIPNIEIADGQGGVLLSEKEEETPGAFTVANKNDTDGDGKIDNIDDDVASELDLMKLVLNPPVPAVDGNDTLTLKLPGAKMWKSSDKTKGEEKKRQWKVNELPKTYWVEIPNVSAVVRDKVFTWTYDQNGISDKVVATSIWCDYITSYTKGKNPKPIQQGGDLDDRSLKLAIQQLGLGLSLWNNNHPHFRFTGAQIGILTEFKTSPKGLENEKKVKFDLTRQIEAIGLAIIPNQPKPIVIVNKAFPAIDMPNDDSGNASEDEIPKSDLIYQGDWPGGGSGNAVVGDEYIARGNALDFVRVSVGKKAKRPLTYQDTKGNIKKPGLAGSRCSVKTKWFYKIWVELTAQGIKLKPNTRNIIVDGKHDALAKP